MHTSLLERYPLPLGALLGTLLIFVLWMATEMGLRLATHYLPLAPEEFVSYVRSDLLASAILGAVAA